MVAGFPVKFNIAGGNVFYKLAWEQWAQLWLRKSSEPDPAVPEPKTFKPKNPEIKKRSSYEGKFEESWWAEFPVNVTCPGKSLVKWKELRKLADVLGCSDLARLDRVCQRIREGADIGCTGKYREPTTSSNAKSAYQFGAEVTDAIAVWIRKGFAFGPVSKDAVPRTAKISGIMVRPKPNGSARIILNLSAPKGRSVNDGISKDDFPASMSSTTAWLIVLHKAGRNCWICKADWSDAYKHFAVREQDTDLQWFSWGGKYFKELALIFGGSSSAGIFDDGAKTVLDFVCRHAAFPHSMVCQHLDDVCAAAPHNSEAVHKFDTSFMEIADYVGVKLAPRDDPEKSFGPSKSGTVFGVFYDTVEWTWKIPHEKLARLIADIRSALAATDISETATKSIVGKIIHLRPLLPAGKFSIDQIMRLLANSSKADRVVVHEEAKEQLLFWITLLKTCSGNTRIPDPNHSPSAMALEAFTDAARGSAGNPASGTGGIMGDWWFWVPWAKIIQHGILRHEGKKVGRKLSALELIGPLITIAANFEACRFRQLIIWVDNAGSVEIWRKGYSNHCSLSNTIAKAINMVAVAAGCEIFLQKITRCSNAGARIADHLSKGRLAPARSEALQAGFQMQNEPGRLPRALLLWLQKPCCDHSLGHNIVREIALRTPVPVPGYS